MNQQQIYLAWRNRVLNAHRVLGDGQCVSLVVNNPDAYTEALFPGIDWQTIFKSVPEARLLFDDDNPVYFQPILNDHSDPNQLPQQGDIMVFDATPEVGFTNQFSNPDGHCGVCDQASPEGYTLCQQNTPQPGETPNLTFYAWHYRPCTGWLHPVLQGNTPTPSAPVNNPAQQQTVTLPHGGSWSVYRVGSGLRKGTSDQVGSINLNLYGPITYDILSWIDGKNAVEIHTQDWGNAVIWVANTPAVIR